MPWYKTRQSTKGRRATRKIKLLPRKPRPSPAVRMLSWRSTRVDPRDMRTARVCRKTARPLGNSNHSVLINGECLKGLHQGTRRCFMVRTGRLHLQLVRAQVHKLCQPLSPGEIRTPRLLPAPLQTRKELLQGELKRPTERNKDHNQQQHVENKEHH